MGSLDEFLQCTLDKAFDKGLGDEYRLGKADGRRAAKGQKLDPKGRGRPPVMEKGLTALMVYHVRKARVDKKITVQQAIRQFLPIMLAGYREAREPCKLPTQKEAVRVYYRVQGNEKLPSSLQMSPDDVLLKRIRDRKEKMAASNS